MKEHTIDTPIGFIYKTTCLVNGKIYIGKHEGKFGDKYIGSGVLFLKAVEKYGRENFTCEVLRYCYTLRELRIWEHVYIVKYKSTHDKIGYNIALGDVNDTEFNPAKLPEVREKMSKRISEAYSNPDLRKSLSNKIKKFFKEHPEERQKISSRNKERFSNPKNHPMYGKRQSKESNEKNRISHLGKKHSEETKKKISESIKAKYENDKISKFSNSI